MRMFQCAICTCSLAFISALSISGSTRTSMHSRERKLSNYLPAMHMSSLMQGTRSTRMVFDMIGRCLTTSYQSFKSIPNISRGMSAFGQLAENTTSLVMSGSGTHSWSSPTTTITRWHHFHMHSMMMRMIYRREQSKNAGARNVHQVFYYGYPNALAISLKAFCKPTKHAVGFCQWF